MAIYFACCYFSTFVCSNSSSPCIILRVSFFICFQFYLNVFLRQVSSANTFNPFSLPFWILLIRFSTFSSSSLQISSSLFKSCSFSSNKLTRFMESKYFSLAQFSSYKFAIFIDLPSHSNSLQFLLQISLFFIFIINNPVLLPVQMLKIMTSLLFRRQLFKPDYHLRGVAEIATNNALLEDLKNVKVVLFDKDDTLVPLYEFQLKNKMIIEVLQLLKKEGKQILIVSNSVKEKGKTLKYFCSQNTQCHVQLLLTQNKKPSNGKQIQEQVEIRYGKIQKSQITIIGDRKMTDIYLGRTQGWKTILVEPIEATSIPKHGRGVSLMRKLESLL